MRWLLLWKCTLSVALWGPIFRQKTKKVFPSCFSKGKDVHFRFRFAVSHNCSHTFLKTITALRNALSNLPNFRVSCVRRSCCVFCGKDHLHTHRLSCQTLTRCEIFILLAGSMQRAACRGGGVDPGDDAGMHDDARIRMRIEMCVLPVRPSFA